MDLRKMFYLGVSLVIFSGLLSIDSTYAQEVSSSTTEGVIRFIIDPEANEPEPKPPAGEWIIPEDEKNPSDLNNNRLPQANSQPQIILFWFGLLIASISLFIYYQKITRFSAINKS